MISIKNIYKTYRSKNNERVEALCDVSIDILDKGMLFITGDSGCGKTTLFNIVGGIDDTYFGNVFVDNKNIRTFSDKELCSYRDSYIGYMFKDDMLIDNASVYDNVKIALDSRGEFNKKKIVDILDKLGLSSQVSTKVSNLSLAQKKKVSIARAVIKNPRIILADEPVAGLDKDSKEEVLDYLKELSKDCCVIVFTQDSKLSKNYADDVVELDNGHVTSNNDSVKSSVPTISDFTYNKPKGFSYLRKLKIAFKGMIKRPVQFVLILLFMMFTLGFMSMYFAAGFNNADKQFITACENNGIDSVVIRKSAMYDYRPYIDYPDGHIITYKEVNDLEERIGSDYIKLYLSDVKLPVHYCAYGFLDIFEESYMTKCAMSEKDLQVYGYKIVCGKYPEYNNEVMVSSAMLDLFRMFGMNDLLGKEIDVSTASDLLGKEIEGDNRFVYTIVGVVDTKPNRDSYIEFIEKYEEDRLKYRNQLEKRGWGLEEELLNSIHTALIFNSDSFKYGLLDECKISINYKNYEKYTVKNLSGVSPEVLADTVLINSNYDSYGVVIPYEYLMNYKTDFLSSNTISQHNGFINDEDWVSYLTNNEVFAYFVSYEYEKKTPRYYSPKIIGFTYNSNVVYVNNLLGESVSKKCGDIIGLQYKLSGSYDVDYDTLIKLHRSFIVENATYRYEMVNGYWEKYDEMISNKEFGSDIGAAIISILLAVITTLILWNFASNILKDNNKMISIMACLGARKKDIIDIFVIVGLIVCIFSNLLALSLIPLVRYAFGDVNIGIYAYNYTVWNFAVVFVYSVLIAGIGLISIIKKILNEKPVALIKL